jgi:hypothetical protein
LKGAGFLPGPFSSLAFFDDGRAAWHVIVLLLNDGCAIRGLMFLDHSCALAVTVIAGLTNCHAGTDRACANTNSHFVRKCWGS